VTAGENIAGTVSKTC